MKNIVDPCDPGMANMSSSHFSSFILTLQKQLSEIGRYCQGCSRCLFRVQF